MTTTASALPATGTLAARATRARVTGVAASAVGVVIVWVIAVQVLGVDLSFAFGTGAAQTVVLPVAIGAGIVAPLAGWAVLALLERRVTRGATVWAGTALVVLIASFALPFAATSAAAGVTLAVMHVVVAAAVVPVFWATSTRR